MVRHWKITALRSATIEIVNVLFLDLGRIAEHDGDEGASGGGAVDGAGETLLDEIAPDLRYVGVPPEAQRGPDQWTNLVGTASSAVDNVIKGS